MNTPFAVPDPEDDATPYPVTLDRVLASVRAMGYQLDVVEEGRSVGAIFDSIPFLISFDSDGRFMSVRGAWITGLDGAEAQHPMFAAADNWNREKYFPTVYTLISEDGSLGVFADLTVDTKAGLTEAQLRDAVGSGISTGVSAIQYMKEAAAKTLGWSGPSGSNADG
ncbi:putative bacterial sensory transduction regulator [Schaalia georgiae F0490]|uniref:Putative bacterial sensory transduction regulator n=1 Tax=Schaalia georgiae F0490 TaxID=1125717 RepID=J1HR67_9ACTO|nr:YbjN domain-containing protein [Schaalia georgiae]EJF48113.1 putative bacterial sensory transduction regulator [Schaalia georgiae F0490]